MNIRAKPKTRLIDMTGMKFDRLKIIKWAENRAEKNGTRAYWECLCDCGTVSVVNGKDLRSGHTRSCGCFRIESVAKTHLGNKTHGLSHSSINGSWQAMMQRCYNPTNIGFHNYGGRGITVCDKWHKFEGFLEDMLETYEYGLSIDRIDNEKGYYKENCKWSNARQQARNRRNTSYVEFEGKKQNLAELRERFNITKSQYGSRIKSGWSLEKALTVPVKTRKKRAKRAN